MTIRRPDNTFLMLNGVPIPVSAGGAGRTYTELGSRRRSYSGQYLQSRRAIKREWEIQTCPLEPDHAKAIRGLVNGEGQSFPLQTSSDSVKGLGSGDPYYLIPSLGVDGCPIESSAQFTDRQGSCYSPYGNRALSPNGFFGVSDSLIFSNNDIEFIGPGLFDREPDESLRRIQLTALPAFTLTPGEINLGPIPPSGGNIVNVCFYFKNLIDTGDFQFSSFIFDGINPGIPFTATNSVEEQHQKGLWRKIFFRYDLTGFPLSQPASRIQMTILHSDNLNPIDIDLVYGGFFVQRSTVPDTVLEDPSIFVKNGVSDNGQPITGKLFQDSLCGATVSFWVRNFSSLTDEVLLDLQSEEEDRYFTVRRIAATQTLNVQLNAVNGTSETLYNFDLGTGILDTDTEWNLITLVYRPCPTGCDPDLTLYHNGGKVSSVVLDGELPTLESFAKLGLGRLSTDIVTTYTGTYQPCFSDLQVLPYVVDAETVKAWYRSTTAPNGLAPEMTLEGVIEERCPVKVIGQIEDSEYVEFGGYNDQGWVTGGETLTFRLFEV